jgi:hypothetical protein
MEINITMLILQLKEKKEKGGEERGDDTSK